MSGSSSTINVEDTNLESLQSKASMVSSGYRSDPFLLKILGKSNSKRRSPSINLGYFARSLALEISYEKLLAHYSSKPNTFFQVLSCGAGFDTSYFRLLNEGLISEKKCLFVEADLPRVVRKKMTLISDPFFFSGRSLPSTTYPDGSFRVGSQFVNIACDLRDLESFKSKLISIAQMDFDVPTVILCECSLTYMEASYATEFFRWARLTFPNSLFIDYEQIRPFDKFGRVMMSHFEKRQTPLRNVEEYPSLNSHIKRFNEAGWSEIVAKDLTSIWEDFLNDSDKSLIFKSSDLFDEFEELISKCNHYILLIASSKERISSIFPKFNKDTEEEIESTKIPRLSQLLTDSCACFDRFGHQSYSCSLGIITVGGFSNHYSRDRSVSLIDKETLSVNIFEKNLIPDNSSMYHAGDVVNDILYIFGGRSSPSKPSNNLLKISISTNQKTIVKVLDKVDGTPSPRWKHSFTCVNEHSFILAGGRSTTEIFSDIFYYDFLSHSWISFPLSLPFGLFSHRANLWKGLLVISGGMIDLNTFNNNLIFIDVKNQKLRTESIFNKKVPRLISHTSHVLRDDLVLIGGVSPHIEPGVSCINLSDGRVKYFTYDSYIDGDMTFNHSSFAQGPKQFVIIGGGGNCFSFGNRINSRPLALKLP